MSKINLDELCELLDQGMSQKNAAAHFNVSEAAVSQAVAKLRNSALRPELMDSLTAKEKEFVYEMASGKSQTQAALNAFDVSSYESAKTIGSRLARDPEIAEAITAVMAAEGLSRRKLVRRLREHVDSQDSQASLRAVDIGLRLHDAYPAQKRANLNVNIDVCPVDLSRYQ